MPTEEVELDRESIRVVEWRMQWLRAGGFSKRDARIIAESSIDWRYANDLLRNCKAKGYDETFVMDLLMP